MLYALVVEHAEDQWRSVQAASALARLESATEGLESAGDFLELGRARERLATARWELERTLRRLYGDSKQQDSAGAVNIQINLG
jgi:hypothetical protein